VLESGMNGWKVPSAGYAIVECGQVAAARSLGVLRAGTNRVANAGTLYQAASISKTVAALTALKLVEEGKVTLDEGVSPKLKSWHLPPGQQSAQYPVTLRRLLGMTAGVNVHGFAGYPAGAPIPTLVQILEGVKPTVNSEPIRIDSRPGSKEEYSGGGYEIAELLMEDVTGERFAELAKRLVFDPLAMKDSNMSQPLAPEYVPRTSEGHNEAGKPIAGRWHTYPERAAAGVWTSPSDLARMTAGISASYLGRGFLKRELAVEMMAQVDGFNYGLGGAVLGSGKSLTFNKVGDNDGYHCFLMMFPETGQGITMMTNSDGGTKLFAPAVRAAAKALHWPPYRGLAEI